MRKYNKQCTFLDSYRALMVLWRLIASTANCSRCQVSEQCKLNAAIDDSVIEDNKDVLCCGSPQYLLSIPRWFHLLLFCSFLFGAELSHWNMTTRGLSYSGYHLTLFKNNVAMLSLYKCIVYSGRIINQSTWRSNEVDRVEWRVAIYLILINNRRGGEKCFV